MSDVASVGFQIEIGGTRRGASSADDQARVAIIGRVSLEQFSDEELVVQYRSAADQVDRDLYINELFRRNYSKVGRWCLRFTDNRETAADLAQEVFAKVFQNLDSFQGQSKFSTWLFSVARNHSLNAIRSNTRNAAELKGEVEEDYLDNVPDSGLSPYAAMERESSAKVVRELLNHALDETEKAVFTLHYGEELPLATITRMLGLENQSGAKAYIVSAKRKLARLAQQWKARGR
jgi:RNA polymerase sigma-70 factor (ECF subfamily)